MLLKRSEGFELEKEQKNHPTDMFNRSEVTYSVGGEEREFQVVYIRYFDEIVDQLTPFPANPVFTASGKEVFLKDIVAITALMTNTNYQTNKRIYINDEKEFKQLFKNLDVEKLKNAIESLYKSGKVELSI
jgi:hypothetical protein